MADAKLHEVRWSDVPVGDCLFVKVDGKSGPWTLCTKESSVKAVTECDHQSGYVIQGNPTVLW